MGSMRAPLFTFVAIATMAIPVFGQTPQPFPRPGGSSAPAPAPQTPPARPTPGTSSSTPAVPTSQVATAPPGTPTGEALGFPVYPTAQFIASYDAGRNQRYYLFGTAAAYAEVVAFYRTQLREKGDLVFDQPPTQMFQIGRFRDETMAFPPGVTVKDWTWGGSQGYPNPKLGAQPERYPTIVMIVPAPPAAAPSR